MTNRWRRVLVLIGAALTAFTLAAPAAAQMEPLHGTVVNESDHGLKDVQVVLRADGGGGVIDEQITDDEGRFELAMALIRPGLEIHLHKDGYDDVSLPITAQHLVIATLEMVMHPTRGEPTPRPPTPTPPPDLVTADHRKRAILLYNEAVELFKDDEPAKKKEAEQMIREAASLDPGFREPHLILLNLAMQRQNWSEASRWAEHLVRLDPTDLEAVQTLYTCIVITRHFERIGAAAKRLVLLDPTAITHVEEHAQTFMNNEQYPMARAMYEALTDLSPEPAYAYLNLGICCVALDDVDGARAAFETFLEIAPADDPDRATVEADLAALGG